MHVGVVSLAALPAVSSANYMTTVQVFEYCILSPLYFLPSHKKVLMFWAISIFFSF